MMQLPPDFTVNCNSCGATIPLPDAPPPVPCPVCGQRADIPLTPQQEAEASAAMIHYLNARED